METEKSPQQTLLLENRARLELTGVTEVVSFDDRTVRLYTVLGTLTVLGRGLTVGALSIGTGTLEICGEIAAMRYGDRSRTAPQRLPGRLFR